MSDSQNDLSNDEFEKVEAAEGMVPDQDGIVSSSSPADMAEADRYNQDASEPALGGFGEPAGFSVGSTGANEPLISFDSSPPIPETTVTESTPPPVVSEASKFEKLAPQTEPSAPVEGCWMKNVDPRDEVTSSDCKGRRLEEMDETSPQKPAESFMAQAGAPSPFDGESCEEGEINNHIENEEEDCDSDSLVSSSDNEYSSSADESDSDGSESDSMEGPDCENDELNVSRDANDEQSDAEKAEASCTEASMMQDCASSEINEHHNRIIVGEESAEGETAKSESCASDNMQNIDNQAEVSDKLKPSGEAGPDNLCEKFEDEANRSEHSSVTEVEGEIECLVPSDSHTEGKHETETEESLGIKSDEVEVNSVAMIGQDIVLNEDQQQPDKNACDNILSVNMNDVCELDERDDNIVPDKADDDHSAPLSHPGTELKFIGITESDMTNVLEKLTADEDEYIDSTSPIVSDHEKDYNDTKELSSEHSDSSGSDIDDSDDVDSDISGDEIQIGVWSPSPLHEEGSLSGEEHAEDGNNPETKGQSVDDSSISSTVLSGYEYQIGEVEELSNELNVSDNERVEENELNELRQDVKGLMKEIETLVHEDVREDSEPPVDQLEKGNLSEAIDMMDNVGNDDNINLKTVKKNDNDKSEINAPSVESSMIEDSTPYTNKESMNPDLLHVTFQSPTNTIFYDPESPIVERVAVEVSDELIDYDDEAKDIETGKESGSIHSDDNLEAEVVKDLKDVYQCLEARGEIEGALELINDTGLETLKGLAEEISESAAAQHSDELTSAMSAEDDDYNDDGIPAIVEDTEILLRRKNNRNAMTYGDSENATSTDSMIVNDVCQEDATGTCLKYVVDNDVDSVIVKEEDEANLRHVIATFSDDGLKDCSPDTENMKQNVMVLHDQTDIQVVEEEMYNVSSADSYTKNELEVDNVVAESIDKEEKISEMSPLTRTSAPSFEINAGNLMPILPQSEAFTQDRDDNNEMAGVKFKMDTDFESEGSMDSSKTTNKDYAIGDENESIEPDVDKIFRNTENYGVEIKSDIPNESESKQFKFLSLTADSMLHDQESSPRGEIEETNFEIEKDEKAEANKAEDTVQKYHMNDNDEVDIDGDHEAFNSSGNNTVIEVCNVDLNERDEELLEKSFSFKPDEAQNSQSAPVSLAGEIQADDVIQEPPSGTKDDIPTEEEAGLSSATMLDNVESVDQDGSSNTSPQKEIVEEFLSGTKTELETVEEVTEEEPLVEKCKYHEHNGSLNLSGKKLLSLLFLLTSQDTIPPVPGLDRAMHHEQTFHLSRSELTNEKTVASPIQPNSVEIVGNENYSTLALLSSARSHLRNKRDYGMLGYTFICPDGSLISYSVVCDGIHNCADGSDEDCNNNTCPFYHFRCKSGLCQSIELRCNNRRDCRSEREVNEDEMGCSNFTCPNDFFQCNTGNCIVNPLRCDGYADCEDNSDEIGCENFEILDCPEEHYKYPDGKCIGHTFLCELYIVFDEFSNADANISYCQNYTCKHSDSFRCKSGHCIPSMLLCDSASHCPDDSDELNCDNHVCKYPDFKFQCSSGHCIPITNRCDNKTDCVDGSDEDDCDSNDCGSQMFQCSNGQCVKQSSVCNYKAECNDRSDEVNCRTGVCPADNYMCKTGVCIPLYPWQCNGYFQGIETYRCPVYHDDEEHCPFTKCPSEYMRTNHGACLPSSAVSNSCPSSDGQVDCSSMVCQYGNIQCCNCKCVHRNSICDGISDCPDGADERNCGVPECRDDQFYCDDMNCFPLSLKCDGLAHCPRAHDESGCEHNKSYGSLGEIVLGPSQRSFGIPVDDQEICYDPTVCLTAHEICSSDPNSCTITKEVTRCFLKCTDLCVCLLGGMFCTRMAGNTSGETYDALWPIPKTALNETMLFYTFQQLTMFGLSHVFLTRVPKRFLRCAFNINTLDLSNNLIRHIAVGDFGHLYRLYLLDLSNNRIASIEDYSFKGLRVFSLLLQNNYLSDFGVNLFGGMAPDGEMHTDEYRFCCLRPSNLPEEKCFPKADQFSSCKDLMKDNLLRAFLWIIGSVSLVGNVFVLISKLLAATKSLQKNYGILVFNLALADVLMGIYMLSIASVDVMYRGFYITKDAEWRNSMWCTLVGALCMTSSQASVLFICLITIDRYIVLKYPFGQVRISKGVIRKISICIWMSAVALAVIPITITPYFKGKFFSKSGVCIALPITTESFDGWEYSFAISVGLNFLLFLLVGLGQCLIYKEIASSHGNGLVSTRRKNDFQIARRLMFVVLSDFFCWVPIGIFGLMTLAGFKIPSDVYAWTIVFVLPINSALNPFLYTVLSLFSKFRQRKSPPEIPSTKLLVIETSK